MRSEPKVELWRLAQEAFDAQGLASEDPTVLDLLVEHPELAPEMDQVLDVERQLQILQSAVPNSAGPQRLVLGFAALVAAALCIAWIPSLWDQSTPKPSTGPLVNSSQEGSHSETNFPDPEAPAPVALIESFELAIVRHRPQGTRDQAEVSVSYPRSEGRKPQVHSFTSSRTRTAPRGANSTY